MIYLYVKTHLDTGLKYLGMTRQDPFKYKGSGRYWRRHLKIHGNNVSTEVLKECTTLDEIKEWGEHYSILWNIVDELDKNGKKMWANEKPETGNGAPPGVYHHQSRANPNYDPTKHPNFGKKHSAKTIDKNRIANSGQNNPQYGTVWINNSIENKKIKKDDRVPEGWKIGRITDFGKSNKSAEKNPKFDPTIRTFIHETGIVEKCTRYDFIKKYSLNQSGVSDLINGKKRKPYYGWRIV